MRVLPPLCDDGGGLRRLWLLAAVGAAALAVGAGPARASGGPAALARVAQALRAGSISPLDAADCRRAVREAEASVGAAGGVRARAVDSLLADLARMPAPSSSARVFTLCRTLRFNARCSCVAAIRGRTVVAADGVVYRAFPPYGFRFHPLASFGRLNALASSGSYGASIRLAYALLARASSSDGGLVWEYSFPVAGGAAPWSSGMTQAVAAQALARVGLVREARLAFRPLLHLLVATPAGPWVRLYSFSRIRVLNAQLQTALSARQYAALAQDPAAARLASGLTDAAAAVLPAFDTGFWSRYALAGEEEPLSYHRYVTSLLWKLARTDGRPVWGRYALRFSNDWRLPPRIRPVRAASTVYPVPADGFRDAAPIRFWISKPATVAVTVAGHTMRRRVSPGRRTFVWAPGARPPGRYAVHVTAVDRVGNSATRPLAPVVVARDTTPPRLHAIARRGRLRVHVVDTQTPWVELTLRLRKGGTLESLRLPRTRPGTTVTAPLARVWFGEVAATDSTGNRTTIVLGRVGRVHTPPR